MRELIIAGNWKMNSSKASVEKLVCGLKKTLDRQNKARVIVFPPYPYLSQVQDLLKDSPIALGAQNINNHNSGAFTGEVSAEMIKDFSAEYVLVGHSERRALYFEKNEIVSGKIRAALDKKLTPILCVGESLSERESGQMEAVIAEQINTIIETLGIKIFAHIIIAYEPIWAIGTGKTATAEQAQAVHQFIRALLAKFDVSIAEAISILYGGSVTAKNARSLFSCADIDGGLVGGASLKVDEFSSICQAY